MAENKGRKRVLFVDDEPSIADGLRMTLEGEGYSVRIAGSIKTALAAVSQSEVHGAIVDLRLPDGDGLKVIRRVREWSPVPIVVLSARTMEEQKVAALDAGADDYLVKPFAMSELVARTKALLRRPGAALGTTLKAGNIVFDTIGRDVSVAGIPLQLPRREAAILEHLLRRQGRVVPKSVLEEKLYGIDDELESNAVPVHVHHLRRKLLDAAASAEIHTVRGVGYLLAETKG